MTGIPRILGLPRSDRKSRQKFVDSTSVIEIIAYPAG